MTAKRSIQICHSDETLAAELSFWAGSAGYELVQVAGDADWQNVDAQKCAAAILELTGTSDAEVDLIEALSKRMRAKVIVVTGLDGKTIASVRRLFQQKSIDAVLLARADFNTRQLADLLKTKENQPALDGEMLAQSIAAGHLVVHYQPKVPFRADVQEFGVEALCRLQHPTLGMVFPDNFIPLAEAHDLILELTDAVTAQAFRDLRAWDEQGRKLRLAINISPRLMGSMTWFELFEHRCQEYQIDPKRITLEVTESSSQGGKVLALEILSRLRLKGFLLSIDDFGTGFSSLETLYKLPFGELKIDKGFVFDLLKNAEARTLVESTVGLARKLGLKICAEGVETEELFDELRKLQCDDAQGYFISKPIAASAILPFFEQWETVHAVRGNNPAGRLRAIHALLADILSGPDDEDDATVVVGGSATDDSAPESATDLAARLPAMVLGGDLLGALELVHRAVRCEAEGDFHRKLLSLQSELEHALLDDGLSLSDGKCSIRLQAGDNFIVGRESSSSGADVAIPCRWLSRGAKNLRLQIKDGQWHASDLGSTNGHFLDGKRLQANVPVPLPRGETLLEVGKSGPSPAPAWLRLRVSQENALELSFGIEGETPSDHKWLLFQHEASIGRDAAAGLVVPEGSADFIADISLRDQGLWIAPRPGHTIHLGGHEFSQAVPLTSGQDIDLSAAGWRVEKDHSAESNSRASAPATAYA